MRWNEEDDRWDFSSKEEPESALGRQFRFDVYDREGHGAMFVSISDGREVGCRLVVFSVGRLILEKPE
jgi:hypothetical protein